MARFKSHQKTRNICLTSPSFGDRPAGTIAAVALQKTAKMGSQKYPKAALVVQQNTYVDNILESVEKDELARKCATEISTLLATGGFFIKKWIFSSEHEVTYYEWQHAYLPPIHDRNLYLAKR